MDSALSPEGVWSLVGVVEVYQGKGYTAHCAKHGMSLEGSF